MMHDWTSLEALAAYDFEGRNEPTIREQWIQPLLHHLGYGDGVIGDIDHEVRVALPKALWPLGSKRVAIDYRPTVCRRGLWIIEAKRPGPRRDWDRHLAQACLYALHPDINVPFVAIADGSRIVVHDLTGSDWATPVVDIPAGDLARRFDELLDIVGARNVARVVREGALAHLATSMAAELDEAAVDETVNAVRRLSVAAKPAVRENRRVVAADERRRSEAQRAALRAGAGLGALGQELNGPLGFSTDNVRQGAELLEALRPEVREAELTELDETGRMRDGTLRRFWALRAYGAALALTVRHLEGCEDWAETTIRQSIREALLGFPDDATARAAYRLDRVLPVAVTCALGERGVDFTRIAAERTAHQDAEQRIRNPYSADHLAMNEIVMSCRRHWFTFDPWTADGIEAHTAILELGVESAPRSLRGVSGGLALHGWTGDTWKSYDPYTEYIAIFVHQRDAAAELTGLELDALRRHNTPGGRAATAVEQILAAVDGGCGT